MVKKRIDSLDFIRVLAMFFIIVYHWNAFCITENVGTGELFFWRFASGNIAHIGVSLFFILSGASLMYTYQEERGTAFYLKKRFLSIYPPYWVCYTAAFLERYVLHRKPLPAPLSALIWSVLGMDGFLSYKIPCLYLVGEWFVGCIVFIYLLFPILYRALTRRPLATAAVSALLFIPYVYFYPLEMDIAHFPVTRLPEVLLGMYFIYFRSRKEKKEEESSGWQAAAGLAGLGVLLIFFFIRIPLPNACLNIVLGTSGFLFLNWIFTQISGGPLVKTVRSTAKYSYVIFLVHHNLIGSFLGAYMGKELGTWINYALFFCYLLFLFFFSAFLYQVSRYLTKAVRHLAGILF